jgi:hypothetical protein
MSWRLPNNRWASLICFCLATVLQIPLERYPLGGVFWIASLYYALSDAEPAFRRRMGVLLGCIAILTMAPIHTDTSNGHVARLGSAFLAVVLLPALLLARTDPGVVRNRLFPQRWLWLDFFYTLISIPLAWLVLGWYFRVVPQLYTQWSLPLQNDGSEVARLFWGINAVGIWDEFFFVSTVFAILRSMYPFWVANLAQAVVYTAVLYDMAFIGIGPILVYLFALTQGSMFEKSDNLLYVLIVHLIVDYFLFANIVAGHYPGTTPAGLLFH